MIKKAKQIKVCEHSNIFKEYTLLIKELKLLHQL